MASPPHDDYYAQLGIHPEAEAPEVRRAFLSLAQRWHPDRAGTHATPTFQRLSTAYSVLSDEAARADYDNRRRGNGARPATVLSRLTGPLDSLIDRGIARRERYNLIALSLETDEAAQGGTATVSLPFDVHCPDCRSSAQPADCTRCRGTRTARELFNAWLTIPPAVHDGAILAASVELPGAIAVVRFRIVIEARAG